MRLFWVLILIWLLIGAAAAGQRHYYTTSSADCAGVGTIAVTVMASIKLRPAGDRSPPRAAAGMSPTSRPAAIRTRLGRTEAATA